MSREREVVVKGPIVTYLSLLTGRFGDGAGSVLCPEREVVVKGAIVTYLSLLTGLVTVDDPGNVTVDLWNRETGDCHGAVSLSPYRSTGLVDDTGNVTVDSDMEPAVRAKEIARAGTWTAGSLSESTVTCLPGCQRLLSMRAP
jgi:hypothetical protein